MSVRKKIKQYLLFPITLVVFMLVLSSILLGSLILVKSLEKSDERKHREYLLGMEIVKVGQKLDAYKNTQGTYPQRLAEVNVNEIICASYAKETICSKMIYKPSPDLTDFKIAAEVGVFIALGYPSLPIPSMPYNKNRLHEVIARPSNDKLDIYLRNKNGSQEFYIKSEWPTYEELAKK